MKPTQRNQRNHPKMIVLNYKNIHYNLIVPESKLKKQENSTNQESEPKVMELEITQTNEDTDSERNLVNRVKALEDTLRKVLDENQKLKEQMLSSVLFVTKNSSIEEKIHIKCSECEITFESNSDFEKHTQEEHFNLTHKCNECGKGFSRKQNFKIHMTSHIQHKNSKKKFECPKCDQKFDRRPSLNTHLKDVHDEELEYKCDQFNIIFKTNESLDIHIRDNHRTELSVNCAECDFQSNSDECLQKHITQSHNKVKMLDCDECDYQTLSFTFLEKHVQITHRPSQSGQAKTNETK